MTTIQNSSSENSATFPLNAWYAVAWDVEVKHELLARTVCNKKLAIYRTGKGDPVILEDACWHRLVPLTMGWLEGDEVVCKYHGLVYNDAGRCTRMPSQETINPSASVRSFPAAEKHRFVWAWMGDPALADPDLIPDLHWNDDPEWAADGKTIHLKCNYRLVLDNLMDLTHETFVHSSSIGNRAVAEAPFKTTHGERTATVTRWMVDIEAPPFWALQLNKPGNVDRWQIIRFEAPATIAIDVGVAPTGTGAPEGDRSQGVNGFVLNTITPETEGSCHYFWSFARNHHVNEQKWTTIMREGVARVFGEDEVVLEAQQIAMDANPDKEFYNLNIDSGSMWARKLIKKMIAQESLG